MGRGVTITGFDEYRFCSFLGFENMEMGCVIWASAESLLHALPSPEIVSGKVSNHEQVGFSLTLGLKIRPPSSWARPFWLWKLLLASLDSEGQYSLM